ncbi:MAG: hypothetical protein ACRC33_23420 [Gemmataceae bacterium]
MKPSELLRTFATTAERLGIPYRVVGSVATITYGEIRYTNDIDILLDLRLDQVEAFCDAFPEPDFYCSRQAAREAVARRFQFNILHPGSGYKINVILPGDSVFDRGRFLRRVRCDTGLGFASAEDVILKKLEYFREGGSDKHIRDIVGVMKTQGAGLDRPYVADWAGRLGVAGLWEECLRRAPLEGR